jgi:hypothetical protein
MQSAQRDEQEPGFREPVVNVFVWGDSRNNSPTSRRPQS